MNPLANRPLSRLAVAVGALVVVTSATAAPTARISPPIVAANQAQLFTLVAEPEQGEAFLTMVELYPPPDFKIDSFAPSEEWERDWTIQSGKTIVQKATWTREERPKDEEEIEEATEQDAVFQFVAHPQASKTYAFEVREWYSDGSVIHWRGARSVAFPPDPLGASVRPPVTVLAESSLGGNGGAPTLAIVALIVAGLGLAVAVAALLLRLRPNP